MSMVKNLLFSLFLIGVCALDAGFSESKPLVEAEKQNNFSDAINFDSDWSEKQITEEILKIKSKIQKMSLEQILDVTKQVYNSKFENSQERVKAEINQYEDFTSRIVEAIVDTLIDQYRDIKFIEDHITQIDNKELVDEMLKFVKGTKKEFSQTKNEFFQRFSQHVQFVNKTPKKEEKISAPIRDFVAEGLEIADQVSIDADSRPLSDTVFISSSYTQAESERMDLENLRNELLQSKIEQDSTIWQLSKNLENIKLEQSQSNLSLTHNKIDEISGLLKVMQEHREETNQNLRVLEKQIETAEIEKDEFGQMLRIRIDRNNEKRQKLATAFEKLSLALEEVKKEQAILSKKDAQVMTSKKILQKYTFEKGIGIFKQNAPHSD